MGIYLDSADLTSAERAQKLGFVKGITTDPHLIAQTGRPGLNVLSDLVEIFDGHVFYQLTAATIDARTDEAWQAYQIRPDKVIIKVPATTDNITMASRLIPAGIECAITTVYSAAQAFLAAQIKASFVIPYLNRIQRRAQGDGLADIRDMVRVLEDTQTTALVAGFDTVDDVVATIMVGVPNLSLPLDLILALGEHEQSLEDIQDFAQFT
jgi:transaldolase